MFVYKSIEEIEKMDAAQFAEYQTALKAHEQGLQKAAIDKALQPLTENLEKANKQILDLGTTITELKETKSPANVSNMQSAIKENKNLLKEIAKGNSAEKLVLKANVTRASITNNGQTVELDGIGQLARRKRSLYDIFAKIPVGAGNHNGTISYVDWDAATTVKAAAAIAEGVAFPQSTAKFEYFTLPLRKLGDTLPVSEEFFEDEVQAAAELEMFLSTNVEDVIDTQIVLGDNTGQNLKGLVSSTPAYVPVSSGITDANIYDLVAKVSESITSTGGAKYNVDFVAMNISDINKLKLKKDANNNYVFNFNDPRIGIINIIEDNNVAINTLFVGDTRFARIYEMGGVMISKGMINAQFTEDFMTIKARKRILFLIRNIDQSGFRKVTSISAALVTLAT
jgi:HK97 family phage major capsid protein